MFRIKPRARAESWGVWCMCKDPGGSFITGHGLLGDTEPQVVRTGELNLTPQLLVSAEGR